MECFKSTMEEGSCSDCKLEIIQQQWTQLLLNWIDKCITPNVEDLNPRCFVEIINKYKEDICHDDMDKAILCTNDVEPFIKYKFPILRLRNLCEVDDYPKKLYTMTSVLLFYCCTNSKSGYVGTDICEKLSQKEQKMILTFCEVLSDMEVTVYNVDCAIKVACENQNSTNKVNSKEKEPQNEFPFLTDPSASMASDAKSKANATRTPILQFKSSITVLPSVVTATSLSESSLDAYYDISDFKVDFGKFKRDQQVLVSSDSKISEEIQEQDVQSNTSMESNKEQLSDHTCQTDCACTKCSPSGPCCGDPGCTKDLCHDNVSNEPTDKECYFLNWKCYTIICSFFLLVIVVVLSTIPLWLRKDDPRIFQSYRIERRAESWDVPDWAWQCKKKFCHKVLRPSSNISIYRSLSRCTLLCMGPQIWPQPIGYTYFSKRIVALSTNKLEYKQSVPSDTVQQYLSEAFKLFLKDLVKLEKTGTQLRNRNDDLTVKKMIIQIDVESDSDSRLRLNTEEAYVMKIETNKNQVFIKVTSVSFCGVRHGLETLSQVILLDQSTGHLITLSNMIVKDAPFYKYRGLMIDTARNFIPVTDLMRTIDAMASCKLNTFHWRISDVTSFPLHLLKLPEFFEYGPYDRDMIYTKEDVKSIVNRAGIRGIRVLIEVAAPGPSGKPWSWSPATTCPRKNDNFTCNNVLCLRLAMQESVFDVLQTIYTEILEMTNLDDIFHLSDSIFSFTNCYNLLDDREGFLDKALFRLKMANKGFLPKLPIVWYTSHLTRDFEAKTWDGLGVQLNDWDQNPSEQDLSKFKVIHSTKWDLSCEMRNKRCTKFRTWQEMYAWKSWRNVEAFTIEGGESILWSDLVDSGNLDYHLWPRAAAVAERLWSDIVANSTANKFVYMRLDIHRLRRYYADLFSNAQSRNRNLMYEPAVEIQKQLFTSSFE